ncbi:MAG: biotin--[acetyl-CoA-carboxylase] ligase [Flavobacteriaceae bacterium]|nr:biotin--[acetyl-CoA-carboxylase] ligase [Flavobacteriaceae bacterium]
MKLIKLSAIGSTNAYLKELCQQEKQQSFTVVQTHKQSAGRGQLGTVWSSEEGKNLTFSVLVNFLKFDVGDQFFISMAVSLALQQVLSTYVANDIKVKWPNDILADGQKIAGVLIENNLAGGHLNRVIIGIGLNVNQECFPKEVPNPTSLKLLSGKSFDLDLVLDEIITGIEYYMNIVLHGRFEFLTSLYYQELFRFKTWNSYTDASGLSFSGKIIGVTHAGRLHVDIGHEKTREFNLKEIKFSGV